MLKSGIFVFFLVGLAGGKVSPPKCIYAIFNGASPVCAGIVVEVSSSKVYVLTAAHCVFQSKVQELSVVLSKADPRNGSTTVSQVIVHPFYKPPSLDYDIALLKIIKPENENPDKVDLMKTKPNPTNQVFVVHWNAENRTVSETLKEAIPEDQKSCQAKLGANMRVSSKMLCANFQPAVVPGGSPLLFNNGIVGIASRGVKNGQTLPRIFTNIANSEIYTFIEKYI